MSMMRLRRWKAIHRLGESAPTTDQSTRHDPEMQFRQRAASLLWEDRPTQSHPDIHLMKLLAHAQASIDYDLRSNAPSVSSPMSEFFTGGESFLNDILQASQYHAVHCLQSSLDDEDMNAVLDSLIDDLDNGSISV
jgi:hypothetical protein